MHRLSSALLLLLAAGWLNPAAHGQTPAPPPALPVPASAPTPTQTTPLPSAPLPASDWEAVKKLTVDDSIRIDGHYMGRTCDFLSADDTTLTCKMTATLLFFPYSIPVSYPRSGVRRVRMSQLRRSGLTGMAIGAGIGMVLGAILDSQAGDETGYLSVGKHTSGTFWFGILGAFVGLDLGRALDFRAGPEVYRAP